MAQALTTFSLLGNLTFLVLVVFLILDRNKLTKKVTTDFLTGAHTREVIEKRIELLLEAKREKSSSKPLPEFHVIYFDLDNFKQANDEFGHHIGDLILQAMVPIFRNTFRRTSDIIARPGGDEFIALVNDGDTKRVLKLITEFKANFEGLVFGNIPNPTQISYGLVKARQDGSTVEELKKEADLRMYTFKESQKAT